MKKIFLCLFLLIPIFILSGCTDNEKTSNNTRDTINNESEKRDSMENKKITIIIDDKNYEATLEDNDTVKAFIKILPQEFNMQELNGNEKYVYIDSLPNNANKPKFINKGDIMLYGDNCLVIFYKSFETNYSYTKIGHIENLPDLGDDNITVKIENNQ